MLKRRYIIINPALIYGKILSKEIIMNFIIDKKAEKILYTLNEKGYEAYIVGG